MFSLRLRPDYIYEIPYFAISLDLFSARLLSLSANAMADSLMDEILEFVELNTEAEVFVEEREIR